MSDFRRCPRCGDFGWFGSKHSPDHRCKPVWECRLETDGDDWWDKVHATDQETAAEKFAERYDCEGGEYSIVGGRHGDCVVLVRKPADPDSDETDPQPEVTRWSIEGEAVPTYRATALEQPMKTAEQPR
jgi:hypothetical protein